MENVNHNRLVPFDSGHDPNAAFRSRQRDWCFQRRRPAVRRGTAWEFLTCTSEIMICVEAS